ncbi:LysM peptidoglycan-binding domain-containing protein [Alginatibacterium sediminis]|uniref:LysM peptidoglycan-binding domain-containing protein n=1 Tax=Alginatibacterium sediminis TaxID=2164068 RepID=A0A420ED33_9ALTE|nr:L,D-transpeptidase family protein [Alginatibacterium sediminis]RKF18564.1 LysM peptidoglycan-binding domain-containing protein [Alginatibacterium sediminis]
MKKLLSRLVLACAVMSVPSFATTYPMPENGRVIGTLSYYTVIQGESMADIAERHNIGFLALMAANPGLDPFLPDGGTELTIPTQSILPDAPHQGIVINLAELRLYSFHRDGSAVDVFPIGIGRIGRDTPEMSTKISQKRENPTWTPTKNTHIEYREKGIELPRVVPAGPDNPLGLYAMRLSYGSGEYLIHGTNKEFGIGMRVSAGCIRLYPDDIEYLFSKSQLGDKVTIVNQPIKYAVQPNGEFVMEVHEPLNRTEEEVHEATALKLDRSALKFVVQDGVESKKVAQLLKNQNGLVQSIGRQVEIEANENAQVTIVQ